MVYHGIYSGIHLKIMVYLGTDTLMVPNSSTKQGLMCLAQGHNAVMPVRYK